MEDINRRTGLLPPHLRSNQDINRKSERKTNISWARLHVRDPTVRHGSESWHFLYVCRQSESQISGIASAPVRHSCPTTGEFN